MWWPGIERIAGRSRCFATLCPRWPGRGLGLGRAAGPNGTRQGNDAVFAATSHRLPPMGEMILSLKGGLLTLKKKAALKLSPQDYRIIAQ